MSAALHPPCALPALHPPISEHLSRALPRPSHVAPTALLRSSLIFSTGQCRELGSGERSESCQREDRRSSPPLPGGGQGEMSTPGWRLCNPHEAQQVGPCSASTSHTELVSGRTAWDLRTSDFQGNAPSKATLPSPGGETARPLQTSSSSSLFTFTCRPSLPSLSKSSHQALPPPTHSPFLTQAWVTTQPPGFVTRLLRTTESAS